jgi:hypothetical protein
MSTFKLSGQRRNDENRPLYVITALKPSRRLTYHVLGTRP